MSPLCCFLINYLPNSCWSDWQSEQEKWNLWSQHRDLWWATIKISGEPPLKALPQAIKVSVSWTNLTRGQGGEWNSPKSPISWFASQRKLLFEISPNLVSVGTISRCWAECRAHFFPPLLVRHLLGHFEHISCPPPSSTAHFGSVCFFELCKAILSLKFCCLALFQTSGQWQFWSSSFHSPDSYNGPLKIWCFPFHSQHHKTHVGSLL